MGPDPTVLDGRFQLRERIGRGSLSTVHAGLDLASGREVAIKLALDDPEHLEATRRRFEREAAALAVIASAHVVELIAAGSADDGRPYLVLERLEGHDLQEILDDIGPLKPARVARFLAQAASALELAHGLGIVHRDLKPANLFVQLGPDNKPLVKVLDFGMVVDVDGPTERTRDAFGGTPLYMAPEQVRGQLTRIGPATDIWALAMITLALLTGEAYWAGSTTEEVMREIEIAPFEPPSRRWSWLPEAFDRWFARSTWRVPERRFASVAEQSAQLGDILRTLAPPDHEGARARLGVAETLAGRTPTPSILRLSTRSSAVIGRQIECGEIEPLLGPGALVTLTGPAGIGKSRLAQAVCDAVAESYPDGTWLVALGPGEGEAAIVNAIATALRLEPDTTRPTFEHLVANLATRQLLLVLDGAEQIAGAAGVIDRLRRTSRPAAWLVTSRLPLGLEGERCVGVEPLELPPPSAGPITAGEAQTFSAVELFARRAREVAPWFSVDESCVDDVVAICRAVEGFPLAIELAAAQMQASGPADIRAALAGSGQRDREDSRRESVRAAVSWSYGLLAPGEQALLRHLAILPAGLTFVQVRRLLGHLSAEPVSAVLQLVQSHLVSWSSAEPRRLLMLDTVRQLCRELSDQVGETPALWRLAFRHAEEVAIWDPTGNQEQWLALVDAEHDNLQAVLSHLLAADPGAAIGLAGHLAWYWYLRGHYAEGGRWLEESIARSGASDGPDLIRALHGAGRLALLSCRYRRANELLERARGLAFAAGDARGEANAVQLLGSVARERGAYLAARALHQRGLELWQSLGDRREAARAQNYLAFVDWLGDPAGRPGEEHRTWWAHQAERELRELGDPEGIVWSLLNRGAIAHHAGERDRARTVLGRAFAEAIAARFSEGIAWSLDLIGRASLDRGEHLQAAAQLTASLRVHRRLGDLWRCASVLEAMAAVAVVTGRPARGALYLGAADALREQLQTPVPTCELALVAATERRGAEQLGEAFATGRERGRRTPLDATVALSYESPGG